MTVYECAMTVKHGACKEERRKKAHDWETYIFAVLSRDEFYLHFHRLPQRLYLLFHPPSLTLTLIPYPNPNLNLLILFCSGRIQVWRCSQGGRRGKVYRPQAQACRRCVGETTLKHSTMQVTYFNG